MTSGISRKVPSQRAFAKYAQRKTKGAATVDAAFLEEIEHWRGILANNLAVRNPTLGPCELNHAVQAIIARLIFLRMCHDRGIETYGTLASALNGPEIHGKLEQLFRHVESAYKFRLFHCRTDRRRHESEEVTAELKIDGEVLKDIVTRLYDPERLYEFSVLPAEILGQVYEQLLGKVIRLTAGRWAIVEHNREVKKAAGVYYTPAYIVDYLVKRTVGKLLEGKTAKQAAKLRILDPACGSGSFLLGAYQYLLEWHRDHYLQQFKEARGSRAKIDNLRRKICEASNGTWRLTSTEKKRILLNNIYGVDIDAQAVEVSKLSLVLKMLEGESKKSLEHQFRMRQERALPDLASNVKCGNSLIGPDFYQGQQPGSGSVRLPKSRRLRKSCYQQRGMFDEEECCRVNAFDWNAAFPHVFHASAPQRSRGVASAGGFDAVIGNPPWGQKGISNDDSAKRFIWQRYPSCRGIYDLFRPFVEQGIRLLRKGGMFGMVLPDIVLLKNYADTRRLLLEQLSLHAIDWWGTVFSSAVIDAATIIGSKKAASAAHRVRATVHDPRSPLSQEIPQRDFWANPRLVFNLYLTQEKREVLKRLEKCATVGDYFEIHEGVHSGNIRDDLFVFSKLDATCRELHFGRGEILPYDLRWQGRYVRLSALPKRRTRRRYANLGDRAWHEREKLLVRRTGDHVLAAADGHHRYASNNFFLVFPKPGFHFGLDGVCALLNSRFMTWYFRTIEPRRRRAFAELKIKHLATFPLPSPVGQPRGWERLNKLGAERRKLATRFAATTVRREMEGLQTMCAHLDSRIEKLILELFELPAGFDAGDSQSPYIMP